MSAYVVISSIICTLFIISHSAVVSLLDYRKVIAKNGLRNWLPFERRDELQGITHTEFFRSPLVYRISRFPLLGRIFKPLAKVGIRTRSVPPQEAMRNYLKEQFNDESDISIKLGLLVYMWVAPKWRGRKLGDMLLSLAVEQCLNKGDKYLLCVHDDKGSGKLIEWYKKRQFHCIPSELCEKGLIGQLFHSVTVDASENDQIGELEP